MSKFMAFAVSGVLGLGLLASCSSPSSSKPATMFSASQLLLSKDAVQGWDTTAVSHAGTYNDSNALFATMDGGAGVYWQVAPFTQALIQGYGNNQDTVSSWVFSYANQSVATEAFRNRVPLAVNDSTKLAPYSTFVAIGDTGTPVGIKAYAHFGNCYFELIVNAQTRTQAMTDAVEFLQVYEKKMNGN